MPVPKLTIEIMEKLAAKKNGKCLSKKYVNTLTKLKWQCEKGHQWWAIPNSIIRGTWCPYCASNKKTIEDMHELAARKIGKCLSEKYVNKRTKLLWQCEKGHQWWAPPNSIIQGSWCKQCHFDSKRLKIEEMHELANSRRGKCLAIKYVNVDTKLPWECEYGHRWEARPEDVKRGTWCPYCAGNIKHNLEYCEKFIKKRNGELIGGTYENNNSYLTIKCLYGHVWSTMATVIINLHSWCPECANDGKRKYFHKSKKPFSDL